MSADVFVLKSRYKDGQMSALLFTTTMSHDVNKKHKSRNTVTFLHLYLSRYKNGHRSADKKNEFLTLRSAVRRISRPTYCQRSRKQTQWQFEKTNCRIAITFDKSNKFSLRNRPPLGIACCWRLCFLRFI